jgi:AcrR family transcriptional regulator
MRKRHTTSREYGGAFKAPKRPPLHRDRVVEKAVEILDAGGPDALTFRRLAADLDVGVATLYWHVDNKEVLLQLALDRAVGEISAGFDANPRRSWERRLRDGLVELRGVLQRHPWAAGLAMASVERGPNLLRHWDRGAMLLFEAGFDEREVFDGLSALFTYVIGVGMQDALWHSYGAEDDGEVRRETLAQATAFFESLDPDVYPSFRRVIPVLAVHDEDEQFLAAVDLIISGLRVQVANRGPGPGRSRKTPSRTR